MGVWPGRVARRRVSGAISTRLGRTRSPTASGWNRADITTPGLTAERGRATDLGLRAYGRNDCGRRVFLERASAGLGLKVVKLIQKLLARLWRALITWPEARSWRFAAFAATATLAPIALIGWAGNLFQPRVDYAGLPLRLISVLFVPTFGEEALFRGLLVPDRSETGRPFAAIALATIVFTAWHGVETLFLRHAAPLFLRPDFLACAAILGAGCAVIRWRTGALWPAVVLHWVAVVVWQTWLGGPSITSLR